ncbi:hypothetical protein FDENT_14158 [Fusarium denticulatum]|uniref:Uncharacterized protein n=1 Tax=Fusarium denticulatum TaxID=48507 RepID=A0A8H5SUG9_9HYPO|nr:hypothetical protein FDENT_14158 [Fusarium denticulatum]
MGTARSGPSMPWPALTHNTTWRENYSHSWVFKGRRERTGPSRGSTHGTFPGLRTSVILLSVSCDNPDYFGPEKLTLASLPLQEVKVVLLGRATRMNQWTFFNKKIEAFKAQPNDGSAPSLSSRRRLLVSLSSPLVAMIKYTNQPFNSARKQGPKVKKGGSDEELSAQVVTNQAQPGPIGSFMPMNEFARPITTLTANVGAVDNRHREFDAQSIYPGDACLFNIQTVGARYWPFPGRAPNSPNS